VTSWCAKCREIPHGGLIPGNVTVEAAGGASQPGWADLRLGWRYAFGE